jgi:hypothetical protein
MTKYLIPALTLLSGATAFTSQDVSSRTTSMQLSESKADLEALAGKLNPLVKFWDPLGTCLVFLYVDATYLIVNFIRCFTHRIPLCPGWVLQAWSMLRSGDSVKSRPSDGSDNLKSSMGVLPWLHLLGTASNRISSSHGV